MAEIIAVDGAQQVRGADDVRVSNVQSVQGFGNRVSNGSGGIAGTVVQNGGAAEDLAVSGAVGRSPDLVEDDTSGAQGQPTKPDNWHAMTKGQRRNWFKRKLGRANA